MRPCPCPCVARTHLFQVLEEELGRPIEEVFEDFPAEPVAAASLAQARGRKALTTPRQLACAAIIEACFEANDARSARSARLPPGVPR